MFQFHVSYCFISFITPSSTSNCRNCGHRWRLVHRGRGGWSSIFERPYQERTQPLPVYHPNPGESRLAYQLTEEEQIRIAQRIGLIQHLPKGIFDPGSDPSNKKVKECVICMMDFVEDQKYF